MAICDGVGLWGWQIIGVFAWFDFVCSISSD